MKLSISKETTVAYLRKFALPFLGIAVLILVIGYNAGSIIGALLYVFIDILPALSIFVMYFYHNKNVEIMISDNMIKFINTHFEIGLDDIRKIYVYKSASAEDGGMPFFTMEHFFYVRILLKSDESIRLTCLLSPEIDRIVTEHLPGVPFERKKRGFNAFFLERFWDEGD